MIIGVSVSASNGANVQFQEDAEGSGLIFTHTTAIATINRREFHQMTPGVGVGDFNGDGALDVFIAGGSEQNAALFMNDGRGVFTDCASAWGVDMVAAEGSSVTIADVDGDGDQDIYAGTFGEPDQLWLNQAGVSFVESGALVTTETFKTFGAVFGDMDGDGHLDLTCTDWLPFPQPGGNRIFRGDGAGAFTDVTAASGAYVGLAQPFTPNFADMDGDGRPDLLVVGDFGTSRYYANVSAGPGASGPFFEELEDTGTGTDENGMGSALGDYDGDGDLDWFITSIWDDDGVAEANWGVTGNRLYRNDGNHQYTDVTDHAGVREGDWGWGTSFADFDHDGWLDLVMVNGFLQVPFESNIDRTFTADATRLWLHGGDPLVAPVYTEVAVAAGLVDTTDGKGLVPFDADLDGDLDLIITVAHGPVRFFRNTTAIAPDSWLQVDLTGPTGTAPNGIGAHLQLAAGGMTIHRDCIGGASFMSQLPYRIHFGFPSSPTVDLRVDWPNGDQSVHLGITAGQLTDVRFADLDLDGVVGFSDLLVVISEWGVCGETFGCRGDLNADGVTGFADVLLVISHWSD